MSSGITNFKRVNPKHLTFGNLQSRGNFNFSAIEYRNNPLTIETPSLVTPAGIGAEPGEARHFLDLELDTSSNHDHQIFHDLMKQIDDRCIDELIFNIDDWFKNSSGIDEDFIENEFKSPITEGWGNEPSLLRVEIVCQSPDDMMDTRGNVISPQDVTSLSAVKVRLQLLGVWIGKHFMGCHWRAIGLVADLEHEKTGRRRASSPRQGSPLPPVTTRGARRGRVSAQEEEQESEDSDTASRRARVEQMLERFRSSKAAYPSRYSDEEGGSDDDDRRSYYDDSSDDEDSRRSYYSDDEDSRRSYDSRRSSYSDDDDGYY